MSIYKIRISTHYVKLIYRRTFRFLIFVVGPFLSFLLAVQFDLRMNFVTFSFVVVGVIGARVPVVVQRSVGVKVVAGFVVEVKAWGGFVHHILRKVERLKNQLNKRSVAIKLRNAFEIIVIYWVSKKWNGHHPLCTNDIQSHRYNNIVRSVHLLLPMFLTCVIILDSTT